MGSWEFIITGSLPKIQSSSRRDKRKYSPSQQVLGRATGAWPAIKSMVVVKAKTTNWGLPIKRQY